MTRDVCAYNYLRCTSPALCEKQGCRRDVRLKPVTERLLTQREKYDLAMYDKQLAKQRSGD